MNKTPLLASALLGVTVAAACAGLALSWETRGTEVPADVDLANPFLFMGWLTFAGVGALLAAQRRGHLLGWLLLAVALTWELHGLSGVYRVAALFEHPAWPGGEWAAWLWDWMWAPGLLVVFLVPLMFPTGRPPSRRWWGVAGLLAVGALVAGAAVALQPGALPNTPMVTNPAGLEGASDGLGLMEVLGSLALALGVIGTLLAPLVRYRRANADERHQLKWFAYAVAAVLAAWGAAEGLAAAGAGPALVGNVRMFPLLVLPVAIGIAVHKYRLYDIDIVIHRSLVYGALAAGIAVLYVAIVIGAGSLAGAGGDGRLWLSVLVTAVVALAFQPVRTRLERLADRAVYGVRSTPYEVLRSVTSATSGAAPGSPPTEVFAEIARSVAGAVPGGTAAVWVHAGSEWRHAASWPADLDVHGSAPALVEARAPFDDAAHGRVYPVMRGDQVLGALAVRKPRGEAVTSDEERLLTDIASVSALVLEHAELVGELRASRARLVAAQDLERRRVERDLHDGAQQRLLELALTLGGARERAARGDDGAMVEVLDAAGVQIRAALAELRDLARGIYPEILTSRGLVPALESLAERAPLPVLVEARGSGRPPAAIEATAYFVAAEALANAIKHARASQVVVSVALDERGVSVSVGDDGIGGADPTRPGLRGLGDRVAAHDGRLEVTSAPGRGTRVWMEIPCASH